MLTPFRRLMYDVEKPSPWLEMAIAHLYGRARSIDFFAEWHIADITYFPGAE